VIKIKPYACLSAITAMFFAMMCHVGVANASDVNAGTLTETVSNDPGVYIQELNAFGNTVAPVATAVPAFIGYTPQAPYQDKFYLNQAVKITSFEEFKEIYMLPDSARQYNPQYYLVEEKAQHGSGSNLVINGKHYAVVPDPNTIYYLYNSMRLFYQNGGGDAYIVSVGTYGPPSGRAGIPGQQIVNPNVSLSELEAGLELLKNETEPTMYIIPEATLLNVEENATLMQSMLLQADEMRTAVCIFDIIGGRNPDPVHYTDDIETFREGTGSTGLNYGVSYYPFVETTIMKATELDYTNLFGGEVTLLEPLLNPPDNPNPKAGSILETTQGKLEPTLVRNCASELTIDYNDCTAATVGNNGGLSTCKDDEVLVTDNNSINTTAICCSRGALSHSFRCDPPDQPDNPVRSIAGKRGSGDPTPLATRQHHSALTKASRTYVTIMEHVLSEANVLPPSGGMAGVYTVNDNMSGVWHTPANVGMAGVVGLPIELSDSQQADLNMEAVSGKSVNPIRVINGRGILVWGARTLDGNSQDWRYVSARRTITFIEQSIKNAIQPYVFESNDAKAWVNVKSMLNSFLTELWKQGGLQGARASDAFQVDVGLGSTMTAEDILNGFMRITVKVALIRPGEFIEITIEQKMQN